MGREFCEPGDALRLLIVRPGKLGNLGFQCAEQLEQLAFALLADGLRPADFRLDFVQIAFIHVICLKGKRYSGFGKNVIKKLATRLIRWLNGLSEQPKTTFVPVSTVLVKRDARGWLWRTQNDTGFFQTRETEA